ncbi:MAG TPA: choice-of-anchor J domain-containing protein [Chitinophagaceae bacterium]|nr:choice-of-anchor J domain-containing protein [Chitinophagaceae bacterium]
MIRTKIFFPLALSLTLATPSMAQTTLPYTSGFDTPADQAGWQLFRMGVSGGTKPYWVYAASAPFSAPSSLSHNYPVGGTDPTDNWFVSPQFNFSDGATIDSVRRSFRGFGKPNLGDTVAIYLLKGDPDPSKATGKVLLYDYRDTAYSNDDTWYKTRPVDIPASAGKSYIAFRYRTVVNWLDVKFDNLSVSRKVPARTAQPASLQLAYYPNPARDRIDVLCPQTIRELRLYDLGGRLVLRREAAVHLDLQQVPAAAYILHALLSDGTDVYARIVKE